MFNFIFFSDPSHGWQRESIFSEQIIQDSCGLTIFIHALYSIEPQVPGKQELVDILIFFFINLTKNCSYNFTNTRFQKFIYILLYYYFIFNKISRNQSSIFTINFSSDSKKCNCTTFCKTFSSWFVYCLGETSLFRIEVVRFQKIFASIGWFVILKICAPFNISADLFKNNILISPSALRNTTDFEPSTYLCSVKKILFVSSSLNNFISCARWKNIPIELNSFFWIKKWVQRFPSPKGKPCSWWNWLTQIPCKWINYIFFPQLVLGQNIL